MTGTRSCSALLAWLLLISAACDQGGSGRTGPRGDESSGRVVIDMRSSRVRVPERITRVATINDGFVESVMTRLGTIDAVVAVGSASQQRTYSYSYPAGEEGSFTVEDGMGTMRALHPWLAVLPCAGQGSGEAINYETIAKAHPQVVILRVGDCTIRTSADVVARTVSVFETMGIPVVVLRSPTDYRGDGLQTLRDEIGLLGQVFGKEAEALSLAQELSAIEATIASRVSDLPHSARPRAVYLGLSSGARTSGGAAYVWGKDTAESWMLEHLAGARNAYSGPGTRMLMNTEQILALDPDLIFLPTSGGYHPPQELAEAPHFAELQRLRAVREGRVYALAWTPNNCARRLEYPIDLMIMAKAAHPERFADVDLHDWILTFYRQLYRLRDAEARLLLRAQWLGWTREWSPRWPPEGPASGQLR
jgi:iron complex transport system substrate-binding protein